MAFPRGPLERIVGLQRAHVRLAKRRVEAENATVSPIRMPGGARYQTFRRKRVFISGALFGDMTYHCNRATPTIARAGMDATIRRCLRGQSFMRATATAASPQRISNADNSVTSNRNDSSIGGDIDHPSKTSGVATATRA
jgi:hypothetical protein